MDTRTLVVGQDVYMIIDCGQLIDRGKVVKVTPSGVDVLKRGELLHFDSNGNEYDYSREYGPWRIDDMPFEERKTELKGLFSPKKGLFSQKDYEYLIGA